jgi:hypothetical protein
MNRHLSADEISALVAGEGYAESQTTGHLSECLECREEVARMEILLLSFRTSVQAIDARPPRSWQPAGVSERRWMTAPRWALAGAFVAAVLSVAVYRSHRTEPVPKIYEVTDAVLLQQVDAQLARSIPGSMEPLVALAWSSADESAQGKQE